MAVTNLSPAPRPHAPPMAAPGYGKRSAPDQPPRRRDDFAHLPRREAAIAAHIDRLRDGAAIDTKTLARELADYGQQAVRSALAALSRAGHLRRIRETVGEGRTQWVYRTYFSRAARDDAWWARFLTGSAPETGPAPVPDQRAPSPPRPPRSPAYNALAALGRSDPRMVLSAAECAELEALAAEWLTRGATETQLVRALTAGLPPVVHSPGALARRRLADKLPPEPIPPSTPAPHRIMECTTCQRPGRPEALPGGLCHPCRGSAAPTQPPPPDFRTHINRLRTAARTPERSST